jgi:hypothetical protein
VEENWAMALLARGSKSEGIEWWRQLKEGKREARERSAKGWFKTLTQCIYMRLSYWACWWPSSLFSEAGIL